MGLGRESLQRFWTFDPKRELGLSQLTRGTYTIGEKRSPGAGQLVDLKKPSPHDAAKSPCRMPSNFVSYETVDSNCR